MLYRQTAVMGIGQIGASFALAGKRAGMIGHVVGVARSQRTRDAALRLGAADACTEDPSAAVWEAELVYLAVPVQAMRQVMCDIAPNLSAGCLVTDAGSTKAQVCDWAAELLPDTVAFIGGHPMAGTEKHGPGSASADMFAGTTYLLCQGTASEPVLERFRELVVAIRARPLLVDPHRHDEVLAFSSHLPHLCAAALSVAIGRSRTEDLLAFAAGGLRDTTRIASASVEMWRGIFATNAGNVLPAAGMLRDALDEFIAAIEAEDWERVASLLAQGKDFRDGLYGLPEE